MKRAMMIIVLTAVAGCTSPIVMRNPTTGETTDCGSRAAIGIHALAGAMREDTCVRDFQAQGWIRAPG